MSEPGNIEGGIPSHQEATPRVDTKGAIIREFITQANDLVPTSSDSPQSDDVSTQFNNAVSRVEDGGFGQSFTLPPLQQGRLEMINDFRKADGKQPLEIDHFEEPLTGCVMPLNEIGTSHVVILATGDAVVTTVNPNYPTQYANEITNLRHGIMITPQLKLPETLTLQDAVAGRTDESLDGFGTVEKPTPERSIEVISEAMQTAAQKESQSPEN